MKAVKLPHYLYTSSLFFLIFLSAVCIAISAADVIIQALTDKTSTGEFDFRNMIVVGGSYVLLTLASLLFSCSRMLTVRGALQDIPKLYIPIKKEDLPSKVFTRIKNEFEEVKQTRKRAEPRPEDIQAVGWAKPGTPLFEGVDFKQAIARTPAFVEKVAAGINPDYSRPFYVPVRQYMEFLMQQGLVDKQLGEFYLEGYETARFSQEPLSQEYYMNIMKHLAAILQNMGYNIKNNSRNPTPQSVNDGYSDSITTRSSNDRPYARKGSLVHRRPSTRSKSQPELYDEDARSNNSRSTEYGIRRYPSTAHSSPLDEEDEEDVDSVYDEDEIRNSIYELLMKDKSSQQQQI
ncbi:hypothetical protein K501DRAFT_241609 [Backusella circina FSU 941]|nr:hypothetical protein K501DRAFT_241609 [Backusella circina FSU 941]